MRRYLPIAAVVLILLSCHVVLAGSPLKGIDVKLGKNPGGGASARTTDDNGQVDFGVMPKGNYTLEFTAPATPSAAYKDPEDMTTRYRPGNNKTVTIAPSPAKLHVVILGSTSGRIERDIDLAPSTARLAPVSLSLSGSEDLKVSVTAQ
jgi:hypothetical protein